VVIIVVTLAWPICLKTINGADADQKSGRPAPGRRWSPCGKASNPITLCWQGYDVTDNTGTIKVVRTWAA
jgi:hypothetical protein